MIRLGQRTSKHERITFQIYLNKHPSSPKNFLHQWQFFIPEEDLRLRKGNSFYKVVRKSPQFKKISCFKKNHCCTMFTLSKNICKYSRTQKINNHFYSRKCELTSKCYEQYIYWYKPHLCIDHIISIFPIYPFIVAILSRIAVCGISYSFETGQRW